MRRLVIAIICTTALGGAANSADLATDPVFEPVAPSVAGYDWSGLYYGLQAGGGWGDNEAFEIDTPTGAINDGPLPYDSDGFVGGAYIGYNMQSGSMVYGVEADAEYSDISGTWDWGNGNGLNKDIDWLASLRARIGFAANRFLIYGTGGLAIGGVDMEAFDGPPPLFTISGDEVAFGYTVGGGVEFGLSDSWTFGAEYRYTDLEDTEHSGVIFGGPFTYPHSNEFHAIRGRITYRPGR
jgi:outer membrane immunogenic protein